MTRTVDGSIVRLSRANWLGLASFFLTHLMTLVGIGVNMHARIAVLESKDAEQQSRQTMMLDEMRTIKRDVRELAMRRP